MNLDLWLESLAIYNYNKIQMNNKTGTIDQIFKVRSIIIIVKTIKKYKQHFLTYHTSMQLDQLFLSSSQ